MGPRRARRIERRGGGIPTCQYVPMEGPETKLTTIGAGTRKFVTEVPRLPGHTPGPLSPSTEHLTRSLRHLLASLGSAWFLAVIICTQQITAGS